MHILKTIIISILIILASVIYGQDNEKDYRKLNFTSDYLLIINNDSVKPFYISTNPITNREYITYLCWITDVYRDYPEQLLRAFPNLTETQIDSLLNNGFTPIQIRRLIEGSFFNEEYMFRRKYLDYPVLGLTWKQAMNFLNWLSDRYNESLLIKTRILELTHYQLSEYNFNTEAYLLNQYDGMVKTAIWDSENNQIRSVKWKDRLLIPSFRLPSQNELNIAQQGIQSSLKEYKPNKFLKYWTKYYIEVKKHEILLSIIKNLLNVN